MTAFDPSEQKEPAAKNLARAHIAAQQGLTTACTGRAPNHHYALNKLWNPSDYREIGLEQPIELTGDPNPRAALGVANSDEMPRWVPGNEFELEWEELLHRRINEEQRRNDATSPQ